MDYVLLELGQLKNTTNGTNIKAEQHATEAGRASHGESTPSVDLRRICLYRVVLDDGADEPRTC